MQGKILFKIPLLMALTAFVTAMPSDARTSTTVNAPPKADNSNLFKRILEFNDRLSWEDHEEGALPSGLCDTLLPNCHNKLLPYKIVGYPLAMSGHEQWAIILAWTVDQDHPDILILASVVDGNGTFFLLSPDGTLRACANSTKTAPWTSVPKSAVRDQFEREKKEWLNWFASLDAVGASSIR